jgi:choline dehydrogenase-like flavoprotein
VNVYSAHRRYANRTEDWPDIQLFLASYADNTDGGLFGKKANGLTDEYYAIMYEPNLYKDSYSVLPLLLRPKSRGRIRLKSGNPYEHPLIFPNYFQHPDDMAVLVSIQLQPVTSLLVCSDLKWDTVRFYLKLGAIPVGTEQAKKN